LKKFSTCEIFILKAIESVGGFYMVNDMMIFVFIPTSPLDATNKSEK
jgi:hypothetical protein